MERVCQGHWLDFSELDDEQRFSSRLGVLGQTVNLRAIALYVRLVDLFDIADDRTPYAIWRFVAPRDPKAWMEWSKHRALSPVTFPEYGDGRLVRFDGTTADPEVWAELEDLRVYCQEQLTGCNDLLARHKDERHQLDLRKIDWSITTDRFTPVNIRFEFHRQRMFEILADEIYQGDSHVFLRELLQNSIDAIRLRRELVQRSTAAGGFRRNMGLGFDDAVYFRVEHGEQGNAIVNCQDYGIGMDEYIIRNYLALAGVSYYQSDEFKHLGLRMDPISRFGVGILSCFMIADRVEILTKRMPDHSADSRPLRIDIPAVERQFRIYPALGETTIGTTVTVHVSANKLRADLITGGDHEVFVSTFRLQVTEYLTAIAGFVEFPIVVDEDGQRTVILHPDRRAEDGQEFAREGETVVVRQLTSEYPWDKVFVPQDAVGASKVFKPHILDLKKDLGLEVYEGTISFLNLRDETSICSRGATSGYENCLEINSSVEGHTQTSKLRLPRRRYDLRGGYHGQSAFGISPSSSKIPEISVYRDGLLLADIALPLRNYEFHLYGMLPPLPLPLLCINLPKRCGSVTDIARRTIKVDSMAWDIPIWGRVLDYLVSHEYATVLELKAPERLKKLTMLLHFYWITPEEIKQLVPPELWPLMKLQGNGEIIISDNCFEPNKTAHVMSEPLKFAMFGHRWWRKVANDTDTSKYRSKWNGVELIAYDVPVSSKQEFEDIWRHISAWRFNPELVTMSIHFVQAPFPGCAPLPLLEVNRIEPIEAEQTSILKIALSDPLKLKTDQRCVFNKLITRTHSSEVLANAAPFAAPFENCFAWGSEYLNLHHPTVQALIRCAAAVQLGRITKTLSTVELGKVDNALFDILDVLDKPAILPDNLEKLWTLVKGFNMLELGDVPCPACRDYVWGSLDDHRSKFVSPEMKIWPTFEEYLRPFGMPVTDSTPEELPNDLEAILASLSDWDR